MKRLLIIVLLLLSALPASATITLRGKLTESENLSTTTLTVTNSGTAISSGDLIVVTFGTNGSAGSTWNVADNQNAGNYTLAIQQFDTGNARQVAIYYMPNSVAVASGSLTVTITASNTEAMGANGMVYAGAATASVVDQTNGATFSTATSSPSSGNITTTVSGDVVVGLFRITTGATVTVQTESTGFTQQFDDTLGTASHVHVHTAHDILSGTSTIAYNPTLSGTASGVIAVASFKPSAGGGPTPGQYPRQQRGRGKR